MKRLDLNCFCGRWPFYKAGCDNIDDLRRLHSCFHIEGGLVSSLEAIFYQDPLVAEQDLAKQLKGTPYKQAMVLNPTLPGWQESLSRCVRELHIAAVRLTPGLHGYRLTDCALLDPVCKELKKLGLPLIITVRLEDERCTYMIKPLPVTAEDIRCFVNACPDIPVLLAGLKNNEFSKLADCFTENANLYADIACFCDGIAQTLAGGDMGKHLVFGSGAPLLEMASAAALLTYYAPNALQEKIYAGGNFARLLLKDE